MKEVGVYHNRIYHNRRRKNSFRKKLKEVKK